MPRMQAIAEPLTALPLWERTRASFARAVAAIGAPAAIAAIALLTRTLRRDIVGWVALLENIVRKLLLAEAAALKRTEPPPRWATSQVTHIPLRGMAQHWSPYLHPRTIPAVATKCAPEAPRSSIDLSRPETWSARFALALPRDPRAVPEARAPRILNPWGPPPPPPPVRAPRSAPKPEDAPLRLAHRLEALRRVLADPLPYARRLARLLPRLIRRYTQAAERFAIATARVHALDRVDPRLFIEAMAAALAAAYAFDTS
ncbi:MAG: hypothetical protein ACT4OF_16190 [Caulobacteraceae bacterium]